MKILIVNGNSREDYLEFDTYIKELVINLKEIGHEINQIELNGMELYDCIGCYNCWVKTPGICCFDDGQGSFIQEYLAADAVIFASPVIMGFVSAQLKRLSDRMIPLVHPFLIINNNRMAHIPRYSHYPKVALLLDDSGKLYDGSLDIFKTVYRNASTEKLNLWDTKRKVKEIAYEIDSI